MDLKPGDTVRLRGPARMQMTVKSVSTAGVLCVISFTLGRYLGGKRALEAGQSLGQKNTALATWTALGRCWTRCRWSSSAMVRLWPKRHGRCRKTIRAWW